jgi:hypothetical protein
VIGREIGRGNGTVDFDTADFIEGLKKPFQQKANSSTARLFSRLKGIPRRFLTGSVPLKKRKTSSSHTINLNPTMKSRNALHADNTTISRAIWRLFESRENFGQILPITFRLKQWVGR